MNSELNLIKDPIPSLIKKIALPASIGTLFQTLFNIVDTFFAGKISEHFWNQKLILVRNQQALGSKTEYHLLHLMLFCG